MLLGLRAMRLERLAQLLVGRLLGELRQLLVERLLGVQQIAELVQKQLSRIVHLRHECPPVLLCTSNTVAPQMKCVELVLRRSAALVVVLAFAAAGWAECAGWQASPEARMACCLGSGDRDARID